MSRCTRSASPSISSSCASKSAQTFSKMTLSRSIASRSNTFVRYFVTKTKCPLDLLPKRQYAPLIQHFRRRDLEVDASIESHLSRLERPYLFRPLALFPSCQYPSNPPQ